MVDAQPAKRDARRHRARIVRLVVHQPEARDAAELAGPGVLPPANEGRVVDVVVAGHAHAPGPLRFALQEIDFLERGGNRLLDDNVLPRTQCRDRLRDVLLGWRADRDDLYRIVPEQCILAREGAPAQFIDETPDVLRGCG